MSARPSAISRYHRPMSTPGFFGHLTQAHEQIELRLKELEQAADAVVDPARAIAALETMTGVLDFFSTVGVQHTDDEEKTLFPRLRTLPAFAKMIDAYDFQHRMAETEQTALATRVGAYAAANAAALRKQAHRFVEVQRAHILAEEGALFPQAEKALPRRVLVEMTDELRVTVG